MHVYYKTTFNHCMTYIMIDFIIINHLFAESVIWCNKSVALAVDGWISTSPNGIHFPVSIIIVHHMEIPKPTPVNSTNVKKKQF